MPKVGTPGRKTLRALVAALALVAGTVAWGGDADVVTQGEALVRAGRYAEAFRLLEPLELRLAGDLKFDYLLARSALETGQPSKASFIYERILAIEPNYAGVRLEMGRAYLALNDYARARIEFETVLRFDNLPTDLREQAIAYAKAAEDILAGKKTVGYAYAEFGIGYDSNPLSATRVRQFTVPAGTIELASSALERSDHYRALSVGGELVHQLGNQWSLYGGADARARWHRQIDIADYLSLDARFGAAYAEGRANVRAGIIGGKYLLDNADTRDSTGITLDGRYRLDQQTQLTASGLAARYRYIPEALKSSDFDSAQASLGWLRAVGDGKGALGLTMTAGRENATRGRSDGDKPFAGLRLTFQYTLSDKVGAFVFAGGQHGRYADENPLFGYRRRDSLYDLTGGLTRSLGAGWSVRGQVSYFRNDSNMSLFDYRRTDLSANIRKDF
jgi:tetratricopeptide (TPR) repeat protein